MARVKILVICILCTLSIFAQDSLSAQSKLDSDWKFRVGPYFWFFNINATLERPPVPSTLPEYEESRFTIDKPFSEIKNSLKFAFLINTEYRYKRIVTLLNITSVILEGDAVTPKELIVEGVNYRLSIFFGEALAGYRVLDKPKFTIDLYGGAKMFGSSIEGQGDFIGDRDFYQKRKVTFVEPILATKLTYSFTPRIELAGYLDYGPLRNKKDLTNQYALNANFLLNKWLYIAPGYRYWLFIKDKEESIFNGQFYGFYIRIGAQF